MIYKSAPIREALFDIRIKQLDGNKIHLLDEVYAKIESKFPTKKRQFNLVGELKLEGSRIKSDKLDSSIRGFVCTNKSEDRMIQLRLDGFTHNLLNNYNSWEDFSNQAFEVWNIYREVLSEIEITRIALRYINLIPLPIPMSDGFQEYITNMPQIPSCLPSELTSYFLHINVPVDEIGASASLRETFEQPTKNELPFILDIDVYKNKVIGSNDEELRNHFLDLRKLKNDIFESCITDKTRDLFK